MHLAHLGLTRDPFERNPSVDEACLPPPHAKLVRDLMDTSGRFGVLSAVVGDAGVGKSTLAGILSSTIGRSARVARTTATGPQVGHLLQDILDQLEPSVMHREKTAKSVLALRQCTNKHWAERVPTVVIVDDAHELSSEAVESLVQVGCAHLILVGRLRLVDKLASAANF